MTVKLITIMVNITLTQSTSATADAMSVKFLVSVTNICELQRAIGPCHAFQTRWYYSPAHARCISFQYGGCQGNHNNFVTEEECMGMCGGLQPTHPPRVKPMGESRCAQVS